jgi:phenylalanyl-tRNA synthetase alpha chain
MTVEFCKTMSSQDPNDQIAAQAVNHIENQLAHIKANALAAFQAATHTKALFDAKVAVFGKQGQFSLVMKDMGKLSAAEKPVIGKLVNEVKAELEAEYIAREKLLGDQEMISKLSLEALDMTLPGVSLPSGSQHPISMVIQEITDILARLGYAVRTGSLIESDRYNFEGLNIPKDHPARDMQDTFYIDAQHVLRTHTSPIQIHALMNEKPPFRITGVGPVFRCDSDVSHSPNFHQIEGFCVDRKVSMSDLKGTITFFVKEFFGRDLKTRFRPSFFPFTEPSAEVDCQCPICNGKGCRMCSQSGWVEIGGCGLTHPNVLTTAGIKYPEWQAFAFGFGIERMAIIKYGIDDIRLFNENNIRFLTQF